jgi:hypothetical protein
MSSFILIGALAGLAAGTILAFFSHLAPYIGAGNFLKEGSDPHILGRPLSRREAHLLSLLSHLFLATVFGAVYGWFLQLGWVGSFAILPLLLVTGLVVLPLDGHGLFGHKQDVWFFVDMLITKGIWALLVAGFAALWFAS